MSLNYFENGYYIPIIFIFIYIYSKDLFLSSIITLKLFPFNYYYHFCNQYNYLPGNYNMLKQFVRFTDSGHLVSLLYYFFPNLLCLAFNIHFVITFGYWLGRICFDLQDTDDRSSILNVKFMNFWIVLNHSFPLFLLIIELYKLEDKENLFTMNDLCYSFLWAYTWFIFIYLPWRLVTNDPVYSILSDDKPWIFRFLFLLFIKSLIVFSNLFGGNLVKFIQYFN